MDRMELLEAWVKLAPNECELDGGYLRYLPKGVGYYTYSPFMFEAFLLNALICAITDRGWEYSLSSVDNGEHLAGIITIPLGRGTCEKFATVPCEALLSAYVTALQGHYKE
jgi:hypothetical protein